MLGSLIAAVVCLGSAQALLYPRESVSREVKVLDGLWQFRVDFSPSRNKGFVDKWYSQPLAKVGVWKLYLSLVVIMLRVLRCFFSL